MLKGLTVLITGGAGSLGSSIVEEIFERYADVEKVIVFSRDELKHHFLSWKFPNDQFPIEYMIGDIRDADRLEQALKGVDVVIHTAALKQIITCENNPEECYKTNVTGTQNVIKAARSNQVSKVLFVSTDKSVDPTSVYGNSKQAGEKLSIQASSEDTQFSVVRLGNLFGSAGSVVPFFLFKKESGELPITDPEMTRFSGTKREGAQACLYALEHIQGGEIFIPKWKSFRVGDLAEAVAPNCRHKLIGLRKHEKMHESFFSKVEFDRVVENQKYFIITKEELTTDEALDNYGGVLNHTVDNFTSELSERMTLLDIKLLSTQKSLINISHGY